MSNLKLVGTWSSISQASLYIGSSLFRGCRIDGPNGLYIRSKLNNCMHFAGTMANQPANPPAHVPAAAHVVRAVSLFHWHLSLDKTLMMIFYPSSAPIIPAFHTMLVWFMGGWNLLHSFAVNNSFIGCNLIVTDHTLNVSPFLQCLGHHRRQPRPCGALAVLTPLYLLLWLF